MRQLSILISLFCIVSSVCAQEKPQIDDLDYLYFNGLNEKYLYPGTLHESEQSIYYTGHKDYSFYVIPITPGDTLYASAGVMQSTLLFLKSKYDPKVTKKLDCLGKPHSYLYKLKYRSIKEVIPQDAHYLYVCNTINGDNVLPAELRIGRHNILEPEHKKQKYLKSLKISSDTIELPKYKAVLTPGDQLQDGIVVNDYDLPIMVVCNNAEKTIVIGAEAHCDDGVKWVTSISNDGGATFVKRVNYLHDKDGKLLLNNNNQPTVVPITELLYDRMNDRLLSVTASFCYASDNHGETWYQLSYFGNIIKRPDKYTNTMYCPTTGIQLSNGILVAPMRFFRKENDKIVKSVNYVIYSNDYGITWKQSPTTPDDIICDEAIVVEYKKNQVMLNSRGGTEFWMERTNNGRRVFTSSISSKNCKSKWTVTGWQRETHSDGEIYDPICNASMIKLPQSIGKGALFVNPNMPGEYWPRKNQLLRYTSDYINWRNISLLTPYGDKVKGYTALASSPEALYFAYTDAEGRILFADLTSLLKKNLK